MSIKIAFDAIDAYSSDGAHKEVDDEENVDPRRGEKRLKKILPYKALCPTYDYRPSSRSRLDIRKYQKTTNFPVAHRQVKIFVREILQEVRPGFRLREEAVDTLHHAVEDYTTKLLMECNALAHHAKRITMMPNYLRLALRLRGARN